MSGGSRSALNKEVRQKALREQLTAQGHVQHVVDMLDEMVDLATIPERQQQLNMVITQKLKLINKYLPDLKAIEMNVGGEVKQYVIADKPIDAEEWERVYSAGVESTGGAAESVDRLPNH